MYYPPRSYLSISLLHHSSRLIFTAINDYISLTSVHHTHVSIMPTSTSVRSRVRRRLEHSSWKSVCNEMAQAMRSKPANAPSKHLFDLPNEMLEMIIRQLDPPQLQPSALDSLQERTTERRAAHRSRDRKEVDGKTDTVLNSQRDWNAFAATCKVGESAERNESHSISWRC